MSVVILKTENQQEFLENGILIHDAFEPGDEVTFSLSNSDLRSFKNFPREAQFVSVSSSKIRSLKMCPVIIQDGFYCISNQISSMEGAPEQVNNDCYLSNNKISSLAGIGRKYLMTCARMLVLDYNPITSNILGLLVIKKLKGVSYITRGSDHLTLDSSSAMKILNTHLTSGRDVLECQEELIQNGYKEFAQL